MSDHTAHDQRYMVSVHEAEDAGGALIFTFVPKDERGTGGLAKRARQFIVAAQHGPGGVGFDWSATADDPGAAREEIQAEIVARMNERTLWIERVTALVGQVERWAREMGWSTRRVDKKLDDARVGKHRVPALLMQEDTCRILLEPVGRSTPGAEGVVDLYLMPAYDDIASLYFYGHQWNLHYLFSGARPAAEMREAEATPLSKEALEKVLAEMRQNAA